MNVGTKHTDSPHYQLFAIVFDWATELTLCPRSGHTVVTETKFYESHILNMALIKERSNHQTTLHVFHPQTSTTVPQTRVNTELPVKMESTLSPVAVHLDILTTPVAQVTLGQMHVSFFADI